MCVCVCFRNVAGAARFCPETDVAGWIRAHRSLGESPQSPAAGAGAQVTEGDHLHHPWVSFGNENNGTACYLFIKKDKSSPKMCFVHLVDSKLTCKNEDEVSVSSDSMGEQLFELVDVYNTGHSQKITGEQPVLSFNHNTIEIYNFSLQMEHLTWNIYILHALHRY